MRKETNTFYFRGASPPWGAQQDGGARQPAGEGAPRRGLAAPQVPLRGSGHRRYTISKYARPPQGVAAIGVSVNVYFIV
jgi:hypothetical protein